MPDEGENILLHLIDYALIPLGFNGRLSQCILTNSVQWLQQQVKNKAFEKVRMQMTQQKLLRPLFKFDTHLMDQDHPGFCTY